MVKKQIVWLALWLLPLAAAAQEVLLPLQSGPAWPAHKAGLAAVQLPFFDDFATGGGTMNATLWVSRGATTANGDRLLPPTIGVATLDAIDATGNLYPAAGTSLFGADTLLSAPIRLDGLRPADSLVLSFYYLPGGGEGNLWERTGETPDAQDSLVLEFYRQQDSAWVSVWSTGGTSVDTLKARTGRRWQYVAVAIRDAAYMDSTFRFRFRNYASLEPTSKPGLKGNCDMWHLDYVYLAQGRSTRGEPEFRDVAFVSPAPSLLKHYREMPACQYRPGEMAAALQMTIGNLYSSPLATHYGYAVVGERGDTVHRYDGGYENAPPFLPAESYQTEAGHASPAVGYSFPTMRQPTTYTIIHTVREGNAQDERPQNDPVRYTQRFANHYAYDDGTAENGYGLTSTASRLYLAYRFDLNEEDTLTAIDLHFNRTHQGENEQVPFRLTVWRAEEGHPGEVLYRDSERRYPEAGGLDRFHRYVLDEGVVVSDTIFVGFEQENNYFINLGFDRSRNTADRIWYLTGTEWQQSILSGSLMLRPGFGASGAVGIEDVAASQIKVYPNPVSNYLHIDGLPEGTTIEIYDRQGRRAYARQGVSEVNTEALPGGLYLLRATTRDGRQAWTCKFIVTH